MRKSRDSLKSHIAVVLICAGFFLFFLFLDGPCWAVDSDSYYMMHVFREPGYPVFLWICRMLPFSTQLSYQGYYGILTAVFFQNLLWIYAICVLSLFVYDLMRSRYEEKMAWIAAWGSVLLQLAVCLLNRFAAKRSALYANHILTEAIAMPLFLLFFVRLFRVLDAFDKKQLVLCCIDAFLLIETRKHMTFVLIAWTSGTLCWHILRKKKRCVKRFLVQMLCIVIVFGSARLADRTYHQIRFGSFSAQSGNNEAVLCTLLYMADEEDADLFMEEESSQREWFEEIIREQRRRGALSDAISDGVGVFERADHFGDSYDVIGYEIVHPVLAEAARQEGYTETVQNTERMYELEGTLIPALFRQDLREYIPLFLSNLLKGLVLSVARVSPPLTLFAIAIYLLYIVLLFLIKDDKVRLFALLVMDFLLVNCLVTGALIFPQSRYMIYVMALFYTAMLLMLLTLVNARRSTLYGD